MTKLLLLVAVLAVALGWWMIGRRRDNAPGSDTARKPADGRPKGAAPAKMLECAHCGVHLPQPEALFDVGGRPYCSEAHRLAGPR